MTPTEISFGVVALLVVLGARVRLHERLPRRGELDRHRRLDRRAEAAAGGRLRGVLQLRRDLRLPPEASRRRSARASSSRASSTTTSIFGALIGAIAWNLITWWYGIPSSSSHALIGGIVGAVDRQGRRRLADRRRASGRRSLFIFVSPLLGFLLGALLMVLVANDLPARLAAARSTTCSAACSSSRPALYSLGHGGNDAQKTIGIIWMLLIASGYAQRRRGDAAGLGDLVLLHRDRPGHAVRRLAHRQDDGPEDHQAEAGRRLLRRDRRRDHAVPRHRRSASRCRRRTRSPARSSASARCGARRRCAGAWPATSSGPGSSRSRRRRSSPASSTRVELLAALHLSGGRRALEVALGGEGDRRHRRPTRRRPARRRRRRTVGQPLRPAAAPPWRARPALVARQAVDDRLQHRRREHRRRGTARAGSRARRRRRARACARSRRRRPASAADAARPRRRARRAGRSGAGRGCRRATASQVATVCERGRPGTRRGRRAGGAGVARRRGCAA